MKESSSSSTSLGNEVKSTETKSMEILSEKEKVMDIPNLSDNHHKLSIENSESDNKDNQPVAEFHLTSLMILCLLIEFCRNFSVGGLSSRYSLYISEKFDMTTLILS